MKKIFVSLFVVNLVFAAVSLVVMPGRVGIHFGYDGAADAWASKYARFLLMAGVHSFVFACIYFAPRLARAYPRLLNLPNKEYWLSPEREPEAMEKMQGLLWQFGVVLFVFLFVMELLALRANMSDPSRLNMGFFLPALGVYCLCAAWWTISFFRAFRIPRDSGARARAGQEQG